MRAMSDLILTPGLEPTLAEVSRVASRVQDPWWVIGSAAIALLGVNIEVLDVDLLLSERDARMLLADWASPVGPPEGGPHAATATEGQDRFRSIFGGHSYTPIPIEIMGALEVNVEGQWFPVAPNTRQQVDLPGGTIYVPDAADQLALLLMFRRTKDLVRAEMLISRSC
jgi:hypothetical protein